MATGVGYSPTNNAANQNLDVIGPAALNADANATTALNSYPQTNGRTVASLASYLANNARFNVKDFGAIGNGVADDTAVIQSVIATAEALTPSAAVYLPKGEYRVTTEIVVDGPVLLVGDGPGQSLVTATALGTNKSVFRVTAAGTEFRDITITGPSVAAYVAEENGIRFDGSGTPFTGGRVQNVEISDVGSYGILAEYAHGVSVVGCNVHDVGYGAITSLSGTDFLVDGCTVDTVTPGTAGNAYGITASERSNEDVPTGFRFVNNRVNGVLIWEAIDTHGGTDGVIAKNVITNCKHGINLAPAEGSDTAPSRVVISDNVIRKGASVADPARGITIGGSATSTGSGIVCTGNSITDMGPDESLNGAVLVEYMTGLVFNTNTITNSRSHALFVDSAAADMTITGNVIDGIQAGAPGNPSGMRFNVASITGIVSGNYIEAGAQYPVHVNAACPGLQFGRNALITSGAAPASGVQILSAANAGTGMELSASATYDPGNLVDGTGTTTTVALVGAALGDYARASFSLTTSGITITAWVSSTNVVSVRFQNESGGDLDIASGTLRVTIQRP